jgi:hypothetical protein
VPAPSTPIVRAAEGPESLTRVLAR